MSAKGVDKPQAAVKLTRARRTAILKALADPRRFELLVRIAGAQCPLSCAEAGTALPISAATLSHHIKELETRRHHLHPSRRQVPLHEPPPRSPRGPRLIPRRP